MGKVAQVGRPRKPAHEKRTLKVSLRLTMAELAAFEEARHSLRPRPDLAPLILDFAKRGLERPA